MPAPSAAVADPGRFAPLLVVVETTDYKILAASPQLAIELGYKPGELRGMSGWRLTDLHPGEKAQLADRVVREGVIGRSTVLRARDGSRHAFTYEMRRVEGLYVTWGWFGLAAIDPAGEDPWLDVHQAEQYTGLSGRTLGRAIGDGRLECGGLPGKRMFRRSWLDAFLAGRHR